ncbi:methionyl-tRNA formyltransferase, mitochondrial-like [Lineus longissimus]|uniref:methionyl-tRNA formyltransferase, mitochondrial-like n=1 Tax=Lineus longissimus TaxID=88925 RepID=UPI00315D003E
MAYMNMSLRAFCEKIHPVRKSSVLYFGPLGQFEVTQGRTRTLHTVCQQFRGQIRSSSKLNNKLSSDSVVTPASSVILSRNYCHSRGPATTLDDGHHRVAPPWRILFFGSDRFGIAGLHALNLNRLEGGKQKVVDSLEVVAISKPTPVRSYAAKAGLETYDWPVPVNHNKYDVGVVVSFGHLIPNEIIHMFPYGILNVHPSLLPRWRGASPIAHTVLNGDEIAGVSITEIRAKHFDIGAVLLSDICEMHPRITTPELTRTLGLMGAQLLLKALSNLPKLEQNEVEQDLSGVTYAHKIKPSMGRVDWVTETPEDIDRQYRALADSISLRSEYLDHPVKLLDMVEPKDMKEISKELSSKFTAYNMLRSYRTDFNEDVMIFHNYVPAGLPFYHRQEKILCIKCKSGWVGFHNVVIKKTMSAEAFYNGYLSKPYNRGVLFHSLDNAINKYILRTKVEA